MVASHDVKCPLSVGELALLYVLHPGAIYPYRYLVLGLARYRTRMTADALTVVYDESVVSHLATLNLSHNRIDSKY